MDNTENISLFSTGNNDIVLPNSKILDNQDDSIKSESIDKAILGKKVKTLLLPEDTEISPNNFIFDFSTLGSINVMQKDALKALLSRDGDIQLYLYKKSNGLTSFGYGNKFILERMIPLVKHYVFNDEIKVYKNFQVGCPVVEVTSKDITKMRLNL